MVRDAVVVGISAYQWLPGLNAPAQDAEAIAQRLQMDGDFRVTRLPEIVHAGQSRVGLTTPVTLAELEAALVRLFKPKGNTIPHTALFYFSGHGLQKDAGIQEGYLATSDANPKAGFYGLSLFWLRRLLQESPVRQRIILLDCCHSGELLNFLEADPGARSGTDRLFMAASREYEAAYEAIAGNYSIFTQALLDGLNPNRLANGSVTNYALTDWVSNALKGEMQQPLFENSGSEIILTRCQGAPTMLQTELSQEICPYRGLECFDEAHAEYFFGREDLTDQLIEKLKTRNFVAVVGASGSGKSSLVRAGLIHQLRQGHKFSGSDRWRVQLITPTDQPLKSLASAFVNSQAPTVDRAEHLRRAEALLQEGGNGLSHLVRASLISSKHGRNSRLLLIIDQFEEVFTLCDGPQAERDRHRFFTTLLTALREASDCLSIVLVLRADFFGKCSLYNGLAEHIEQNLVTLTPLTYNQIKASVVKPAQKAGLVCDPNLVYNILLDVVGAPGELPLLQYTLLELWRQRQPDPHNGPARLTLDAYTELGGVRGTLQKRADTIFYSLTPEEQQVAKRVFIALTQLGDGTEDTRRRILKSDLVSSRFPVELVERVLEKLVMAKLVVTNQVIAANNRYQERVDQGLANVSTALRLAQICQGKFSQPEQIEQRLPPKAQSHPLGGESFLLSRITQLPVTQLNSWQFSGSASYQETIDVAHEALIRNWALLRTWLDENREMLRRQRRIELLAQEWQNNQTSPSTEYLLHGDRLIDAEDYLKTYPDDLSDLARRYIAISREEKRRTQKELRLVQMAVPCTLLVALAVTFVQYRTAVKSQAEKDYQLQIATSRQQAAIAQSLLQEPSSDPTTALLISRLAAEQGGRTYEAQASLRAALQHLRLQETLQGHQGAIHQVSFSPSQRHLATAGADGSIRIWSLKTHTVERVLQWEAGVRSQESGGKDPAIMSIAFSPDGKQLAAIARGADQIQGWAVESGERLYALESAGQTQLTYSPDGNYLLTAGGNLVQLWQLSSRRAVRLLRHPNPVNSVVFSPDGEEIATAGEDGNLRLWQINNGQLRDQFVPGSRQLNQDQSKRRQTVDPPNRPLPPKAPLHQLLFSPNGQYFATVSNQQVQIWDVRSGKLQAEFKAEFEAGKPRITFSPDSQRLATTTQETGDVRSSPIVRLWDVATGRLVSSLRGHVGAIESIHFSQDGSLLATAGIDGSVRLWAAEPGSEFPTLKMAAGQIQSVSFRETTASKELGLPALAAAIKPPIAANHPSSALGNADGFDEIMAVAVDGTIQSWHLPDVPGLPPVTSESVASETKTWIHTLQERSPNLLAQMVEMLRSLGNKFQQRAAHLNLGHTQSPSFSASPLFAASTNRPDLTLTASEQPNPAAELSSDTLPISTHPVPTMPPRAGLTAVALNANSQLLATATQSGNLEIWKLQSNNDPKYHIRLQLPPSPNRSGNRSETGKVSTIRHLAFSPNSQVMLGVGDSRTIYLWDLSSGKLINQLTGQTAAIAQAQFSPDGQKVVSFSRDRTLQIWQVSSGKVLHRLNYDESVSSAQFSPDGQQLAIASRDGTARIVDAETGTLRVLLTGHRSAVLDARFSPDGATLVTASTDGTARLWDARTGTEQAILRPNTTNSFPEPLQQAFFSPDGRYVATLGETGKLYVWAATWEGLLKLARDRSLRQLQPEECLRLLRLPPTACPQLERRKERGEG